MEQVSIRARQPFNFTACLRFLDRSPIESLHKTYIDKLEKPLEINGEIYLFSLSETESGNLNLSMEPAIDNIEFREQAISYFKNWLDLDIDLAPFYQMAEKDPLLKPIVKRYSGLRLIGIPGLFESLCWSVIGQQINLTFAYKLKSRLVETYGRNITFSGKKYYLFPEPEDLINIQTEDLLKMQFSRGKAEYILGIAELMRIGNVTLEDLQSISYEKAYRKLTDIRGIGDWSANYVLMKCLRHPDALPAGDVGLQNALRYHLKMERKPSQDEVRQIAKSWNGWSAYATFYLWHSLFDVSPNKK